MKYVSMILAAGLCIAVLGQNRTEAGSGAPRSVPVIVQDVMPPSKMVARSLYHTAPSASLQIPIPLDPGQVFILTAWTVDGRPGPGDTVLHEGPTPSSEATRDTIYVSTERRGLQHVFPTGIRFPRDAAGMAAVYVYRAASVGGTFTIHGYITDDF